MRLVLIGIGSLFAAVAPVQAQSQRKVCLQEQALQRVTVGSDWIRSVLAADRCDAVPTSELGGYMRFDIATKGEYELHIERETRTIKEPDLLVFDSAGKLIRKWENTPESGGVLRMSLTPGTYYMAAHAFVSETAGRPMFRVSLNKL